MTATISGLALLARRLGGGLVLTVMGACGPPSPGTPLATPTPLASPPSASAPPAAAPPEPTKSAPAQPAAPPPGAPSPAEADDALAAPALFAASAPHALAGARLRAYVTCANSLATHGLLLPEKAPLTRFLRHEGVLLVLALDDRTGFAVFVGEALSFLPLPEAPRREREYKSSVPERGGKSYSHFKVSAALVRSWGLYGGPAIGLTEADYLHQKT